MRKLDAERIRGRLDDIRDAVAQIEMLPADKSLADLSGDRAGCAAFERFLEIISEASRHIPDNLKAEAPEIGWRAIAAIGNQLRHSYQQIDLGVLWDIRAKGELAELDRAVARIARALMGDGRP
jgi:uncharacterized protein with HEPN domain